MAVYEGDTYTVDEYKKLNTATGKEFGKAGEEIVGKQAQDWRNQGSPIPGTKEPEDIRSLGSQLIDWATTPAGNATLGGLGLLAAGAVGTGLKGRKGAGEQGPRVEPTFNDPPPPPPPPGGGPRTTFSQADVTDVASRPVGQPRAQLGGPVNAPMASPVAPAPTAPTAPSGIAGGAPAPANVPPAPVAPAPAPVDPLMQAKLDAIAEKTRRENEAHANDQRRLDEIHQTKLANEAKRAEQKIQGNQGKAVAPTSADEQAQALIKKSEKNALANSVAQASKQPPTTAPVTVAPPATPTVTTTPPATPEITPPATTTPAPTTTPTETPEQIVAKKEAVQKAVLGTETTKPAKWPGGAEGSALQLFGGTKKNFTPESQASLEMFKDYVGGQLTMPPSGGSIHQIDQASKFYEKYTGKPLPRSPEGKLVPIPEAQIKELHAGINTELSDAVKGNKLGPLGKGALAAAALLGLTDAVQAAQKGDFGPLRQAGFDIGGPVAAGKLGLGLLSKAGGAGFSALTYTGGLNEGEGKELARRRQAFQQESQKLGSPFRSVPPPR